MTLHFRDIQDWTPASISIVDKPYHPLAVFEVYEDDDEFIKKYINPNEDEGEIMTNNNPAPGNGDNVTVSGSFMERLLDKLVAKSEPAEPVDSTNKEILEELKVIRENQAKTDERIAKLENPEPTEPPADPPAEPAEGDDAGDGNEPAGEPQAETVELPLNSDGTLDMENAVVAKYLPSSNGNSHSVDPDLTITPSTDKSFNERSGRDSNGMSW